MKHTHKKEERRGAVICGAYGRGNAGDDAILRAIMQEMRQLDETMPMRVISRNPTETSRRFGVSACHTFHFKEIWQAVGKAELFVSGGGSLIQNATSSRSLYYYLMTLLMAKLRGCKVMMYGSGIGPVYGKFHRWAAGKIIDRCVDVATLRDEDSRRELGYMGVRKPKMLCTADPTISIHQLDREQGNKLLEYLGIPADGEYLGLGLRQWKGFDEAVENIAEALEYAYKAYGLIPVFVPIEYPNDCQAAKKVIDKLNCPYYLISEQLEISETVSVLAHMKAMIGMRLHSLIFAVENGVPSVGVSYDMKVDGFLKSIGCADALLHIESVTARQLQKQIDRCMQAQERSKWQQAAQVLTNEESKNLHEARKLLHGACTHQSNQASEGQKTMRQQKKRIAIFQSDLHVGGIQKSLVNLMSLEAMDKYDVDVYLFDRDVFFDLSDIRPHIQIHYLKAFPYYFRIVPFGAIMKLMPRFKFATTEPYDVAIDFSNYQQDCAFGALTVPAKKRVMWIHNDMEIKYREEKKYRILWTFFHSKFHRFSEFVAVSDGIIQPFKNKTGLKNAKVTAIPNLIDTHEIFEKCDKPIDFDVDPNKFNIASMGHLYHQKGYDIMLDQLKEVCEKRKDLAVYIFGDGPDHQALVEQAKRNGLEHVVHFMGYQSNPYPYLNKMDAFYLESRYEGQGMVLWEAKALGLPLIFPKRLEKYNISLKGTEDIQDALLHMQRTQKTKDDLHEYNDEICRRLIHLIESD
ncbi:polysaccharide pyruvyl transferase CsaB [Butyricicoccus sp.]|uniref:polysaccharide pyruvyl transferase CsaB n=1 Tax=Butyricicoccus sp. TaxID=2049021 RepID=UPI003AAB5458